MSGYHDNGKASIKEIKAHDTSATNTSLNLDFTLDELKGALRDGLHSLCTATGLAVLYKMMEEDVTALVGPKGKHNPNRIGVRHGSEDTSVVLSGQKVAIKRPRIRTADGAAELPIETYEAAKNEDLLLEAALARMLYGLSSRNYRHGQDPLPEDVKAHGTSKSAVSRRFIQATEAELKKLMHRELAALGTQVLLLDGVEFAGTTVIVAMGIDREGTKHILGIRHGATENATVCKDLLADLMERGLHADEGLLAIIDGSKALRSALKAVFGERVFVQRCQVHKRRNVLDYLPKHQRPWINRQLTKAWAMDTAREAIRQLQSLATQLESPYPDAASSLREGLDETVTVIRLGVSGALRKSLSTTNAIESAFDTVRTRSRNVKRWKNGRMIQRWTAAGLLAAEERFRRINGYREMPMLRDAIQSLTMEEGKEAQTRSSTA